MECVKCSTPLPSHARFCMTCGNDVSGDTQAEPHGAPDPEQLTKLQAELGADYVVERELGRGGMAVVYLGQDVHIGRRVAIKLLPPELTYGHGSSFIDRFKREARTAGTLDHPNIIPIFRVSSSGKLFWYVMKYVEGESLQATLEREGQMSAERVTSLLTPVADALDYAHRKNVIHRDVKPANILVDADGKITVTDFGIAKALGSNSLTGSGSILGTPHYMSPEQCSGKKLTGASDQYSLAVTVFQLFAGALPFTGDSAVELIKQHTLDPPPPLRDLRPDLHERVADAVTKALSKRPEDRFATTTAFLNSLKPAVIAASAGRSVKTPPIKPQVRIAPPTPPEVSPATGTERRPRSKWRIRWYEAVGAVALGFGAVLWLNNGKQDVGEVKPEAAQSAADSSRRVASPPPVPPTNIDSEATKAIIARDDSSGNAPTSVSGAPAVNRATKELPRGGTEAKQGRPVADPRPARLALRLSPIDAVVMRNGERVRGDTIVMPAGRHLISVDRAGYRGWSELVTVKDGDQLARIVTLQPMPAVEQPTAARTEQVPPSGPATPTTKVAGPARIFVGTNIPAEIRVNGRVAANPVNNLEVPAGAVTIRFVVTDSLGTWETDSTVTVAADAVFRRRFQLARVTAGSRATQSGPVASPSGGAPATGRIFIGTNVPASLTVNGEKLSNPVNNLEVVAGPVRVHFEVQDEQGVWQTDSTIMVAAGAVVRKRFQLRRP